jgi:hypothetical protein
MAIGREDYEERKENRIDRYAKRAQKAAQEAEDQGKRGRKIADTIPFGQPVLVGHHSEGWHRRDLGRIQNAFEKSRKAGEKAAYYQDKAETAAINRAISGDNPDAVNLYREKLVKLEAAQERMKAVNKAFSKGDEALKALGLDDVEIGKIKKNVESAPSFAKKPYPTWALSNNNAEIRRIKEQIESLEKLDNMDAKIIKFSGGELRHNTDINRVQFVFDDIPSPEIRLLLKSNGFKWAPSESAWQRQRTVNAIRTAEYLLSELK